MHKIQTNIAKINSFIKSDLWRLSLDDLPKAKSILIQQLRIIIMASRGFVEDRCKFRASELTFYTLLSIVPIVAMIFGIAKGFGFEKILEQQLMDQFAGQEEVLSRVIMFANSLLENTKGGLIAGVGLVALFWAVIKVLGNIEHSFNDIWGVKIPRTFGRKLSDYLSIMLVCPVLIIVSSSASVFISTQVTLITEKIALLGVFSSAIYFALNLIPYCVIWILFTFIFIFMPNTKVNFLSALLAGIIAGTIYVFIQYAYISFQVGVAKYNAIYGSFAALPLFLIWLQLSWLIVLFGAELSFAQQNVDTYEYEPSSMRISHSYKTLLSLVVTRHLVANFSRGERPLTATHISQALNIPVRLVRQLLYELVECRIISDTSSEEDKERAYQPARDISLLTIHTVVESLEHRGDDDIPVVQTDELQLLSEKMEKLGDEIAHSPSNMLLRDI